MNNQSNFDDNIPMPEMFPRQQQRGNNQQQNNQRGNGNQQQNYSARPIQANANDVLYQLVTIFQPNPVDPQEYYYVPSNTYMMQGRGVVNGAYGFRSSQIKGYAFYEGDGILRYMQPGDQEYEYVSQCVNNFITDWYNFRWVMWPQYEQMMTTPEFNRMLKKSRRNNSKVIQPLPAPGLSWVMKLALLAVGLMSVIAIVMFLVSR